MSFKRILLLIAGTIFLLPLFGEKAAAGEEQKYWVFFRDKGSQRLSKQSALLREATQRLSPRALQRRAKVLSPNALVDESDFDLYQPYLDELAHRGFQPIVFSRWLNAISVYATPGQIDELKQLPFVERLQPVAHLKIPPAPPVTPEPPLLKFAAATHRFTYGASLAQIEQIRAAELHDAGIYGTGVIVGMIDSGFRWQSHEAFQHLKGKVIAEHDFINNDDITRNQPGDPDGADCARDNQDCHGTLTLSVLGGFMPGELIGPAFGAKFIFAKTEFVPGDDFHAEEDYWAAAIEWMEGLGVEVVSTSVGYSNYFASNQNYSPADMDGKTTIVTRAAENAASKGVVVVNSAGNERGSSWDIITAPADGPNVIAVGAVDAQGNVAYFSSRGPTADGRTKPDVMAMGIGVRVVSHATTNRYGFNQGTSFSCPLVGGVVAQILSAHPDLTPAQVMEALHQTASRASNPDNDYGWGIVNARASITYWGPAFSNEPEIATEQTGVFEMTMRVLSRDGIQPGSMRAHYAPAGSTLFVPVTMTQGDSISYLAQIPRPARQTDTMQVYFSATDLGFGEVSHPKREPRVFLIRGDGLLLNSGTRPTVTPREFALQPSRPNPFGSLEAPRTRIIFDLPNQGHVRIQIYNILGQRVRTLFDAELPAARYDERFFWDGTDDSLRPAAGGVYFYEIETPFGTGRGKVLLLR